MILRLNNGKIAILGGTGTIAERVEVSKRVELTFQTEMLVFTPDEFMEILRSLYLRSTSIQTINKELTKRAG